MNMDVAKKLDCCGLFCPMPIINAKTEIDKIKSGDVIEILADDSGFEKDISAWCNITGHKLLEFKKDRGILKACIQKK
jgi:TusA-related sulfurtransferase